MAKACEIDPSVMLQLIGRIERMERELAELGADIQELYSQASAKGYDNRIVRRMVKLRRVETGGGEDDDTLNALYREAVDIGVHESWF